MCVHKWDFLWAQTSKSIFFFTELKMIRFHTLQVLHGGVSQTVLPQDWGSFLTLLASRRVLAASQRVFHVGVGDENDQLWVFQGLQRCLQGPESHHKRIHAVGCSVIVSLRLWSLIPNQTASWFVVIFIIMLRISSLSILFLFLWAVLFRGDHSQSAASIKQCLLHSLLSQTNFTGT